MNGRCRCRYQHHTDRRDDFRRDVDFGLPERTILTDDRRNQRGRRGHRLRLIPGHGSSSMRTWMRFMPP